MSPVLSLDVYMLDRWFFCLFLTYFWTTKLSEHKSSPCHSRLALYVTVTWPWTWLILSLVLVQINRWLFFLFLTYFWSTKSSEHKSSPWHSRVTLYVTVTWPWTWLILSLVLVQINRLLFFVSNLLLVTLPWHTRSRVNVTVVELCSGDFFDQK